MQFKIKKTQKDDPSKITEDIEYGENPEDIIRMYDILGFNVEILESMGDPSPPVLPTAPPAKGSGIVDDQTKFPGYQTPMQQQAPEVLFEINGVQCKAVNGVVYKKDWQKVDMEVHRIDPDGAIEKLDWIEVEKNTPEKETKEPEPGEQPNESTTENIEVVPETQKKDDQEIPLCDTEN